MNRRPNLKFKGETYVAFSDLCGFEDMMKDPEKAYKALDHLFESVFEIQQNNRSVKALAVSDCVTAWVGSRHSRESRLKQILRFVEDPNIRMASHRYLMRTTIAWGDFEYEERIQLHNLQKSMIRGGAYLSAYVNNNKAGVGKILLLNNQAEERLLEIPHVCEDWKWGKSNKGCDYIWAANRPEDIMRFKGIRANRNNKYEPLKNLLQELVTTRQGYINRGGLAALCQAESRLKRAKSLNE